MSHPVKAGTSMVNKEKISASVADGVLTIQLPKMQQEEQKIARQISIG